MIIIDINRIAAYIVGGEADKCRIVFIPPYKNIVMCHVHSYITIETHQLYVFLTMVGSFMPVLDLTEVPRDGEKPLGLMLLRGQKDQKKL